MTDPRLDYLDQSISGEPITTNEQKRVVSALKRLVISKIKSIKTLWRGNNNE